MLAVRWHVSGDESLRWDCEECQAKKLDVPRNCAFLGIPEEEWNQTAAWNFDPRLRQCPKSVVSEEAKLLVLWWRDWKTLGLLPHEGPLGDQPNWIVEGFGAAEAAWQDMEAQRASKQSADLSALVKLAMQGKRRE